MMASPPGGSYVVTERTLALAVERGLLSPEQATGLRDLAVGASTADETLDDEKLRFISGFGDIFVTIGLALFLGSLAYFGLELLGGAGTALAIAAAGWALAEFFTRSRRMALPSIVLLLVYSGSAFLAAILALMPDASYGWPVDALRADPIAFVGASLVTLGATALHYWRFRVPITLAAGAAALVAAIVGLFQAAAPGPALTAFSPLVLVCGLLVFALAMRFDISDPQRLTRRTDIAFWLHMLAAPLIVHPLVNGFLVGADGPTPTSAWGVLAVFAILGLVAVLVDRRAVLVSGLAYAGFAFAELISDSGLSGSVAPLTLLVLGAFVLVLSAGWHGLRRALMRLLPADLARRLPHPQIESPKVEYTS